MLWRRKNRHHHTSRSWNMFKWWTYGFPVDFEPVSHLLKSLLHDHGDFSLFRRSHVNQEVAALGDGLHQSSKEFLRKKARQSVFRSAEPKVELQSSALQLFCNKKSSWKYKKNVCLFTALGLITAQKGSDFEIGKSLQNCVHEAVC